MTDMFTPDEIVPVIALDQEAFELERQGKYLLVVSALFTNSDQIKAAHNKGAELLAWARQIRQYAAQRASEDTSFAASE